MWDYIVTAHAALLSDEFDRLDSLRALNDPEYAKQRAARIRRERNEELMRKPPPSREFSRVLALNAWASGILVFALPLAIAFNFLQPGSLLPSAW